MQLQYHGSRRRIRHKARMLCCHLDCIIHECKLHRFHLLTGGNLLSKGCKGSPIRNSHCRKHHKERKYYFQLLWKIHWHKLYSHCPYLRNLLRIEDKLWQYLGIHSTYYHKLHMMCSPEDCSSYIHKQHMSDYQWMAHSWPHNLDKKWQRHNNQNMIHHKLHKKYFPQVKIIQKHTRHKNYWRLHNFWHIKDS